MVFASEATNLETPDTNGVQDVFVQDTGGIIYRVSLNSANTDTANGASFDPAISGDAEFIAFATEATNIVAGGLNGQRQIVRIERTTPANRVLISQSAGGAQADGPCYEPSISDSGNIVAFFTLSSNLGASPDSNSLFDVYRRDVSGNTTLRWSADTGGNDADGHSGFPSLSGDGSKLVFGSLATDLVGTDANGRFDVFINVGGIIELVSQSSTGTPGNSDSDVAGISLDSRYIAFRSAASTLDGNDSGPDDDVFLRDRNRATTTWQSVGCPSASGWGGFGAATNSAVGTRPYSVSLGDVDGDGDLDLATANLSSNNVSVLLNNGAGSFGSATNSAVGTSPYSVTLGDVDGDGDLDLATANYSSNNVSVLLNNGAGSFGSATNFTAGNGEISVTLGDVDGDGDLDLATANYSSNNVSVLLNNGHPRMGPITTTLAASGEPRSPLVADFNGDGHMDVAWCEELLNRVVVSFGDSDGDGELGNNSSVTASLGAGAAPRQAVHADFDNDGDLDIITANHGTANTTTVLRNFSGGFNVFSVTTLSDGQAGVAVADFDNDGDIDAAITSENTNVVTLLENTGFPSFTATTIPTGTNPLGITAGHLNGDGNVDLVVANFFGGVRVYTGNGDGTFNNPGSDIAVGGSPQTPRLADLDDDGDLDIAVTYSLTGGVNAPGVTTLLNDGAGNFPTRRDYRQPYFTVPGGFGSFTRELSLFDIGCDGVIDILSGPERRGSPHEYVVEILRGIGNGLFHPGLPVLAGPPALHDHLEATAGDMNGDGALDLVTTSNGDDVVRVRLWVP